MAFEYRRFLFILLIFSPKYTDSHECKLGYYGRKCENQCGECVGGPIFCDPSDGFCYNGCARGYRGKICSEKCPAGTYGVSCREICSPHCLDPVCDVVRGNCSHRGCTPGYHGKDCTQVCPVNHYGEKCAHHCDCEAGCGCDPVSGACHLPEKCRTLDKKHMSAAEEGKSRWHGPEPREKRDDNDQKPPGDGGGANSSSPAGESQTNKTADKEVPEPRRPPTGEDREVPESKRSQINESAGQKEPPVRETFSNVPRNPGEHNEKDGTSKRSGTQMMCSKLEQEFSSLKEKLNNKVDIPLWPLAILLIITSIILISIGLWDMWQQYKRELYMAEWEKENLDKPLEEAALLAQSFE